MDKKKKKWMFAIALLAAAPAVCNHLISATASVKDKKNQKGSFYDWRLGKIHYRTYGSGAPVLLLHNTQTGAGGHEWQNNINSLSKTNRLYVMDLPGFGYSDKPDTIYTAYTYATCIRDFIHDIIGSPCAIAASSGSCVFTLMACKLYSANIHRILLISPTGLTDRLACNHDKFLRNCIGFPLIGTSIYHAACSRAALKKELEESLFAKESLSPWMIDHYWTAAHANGAKGRFAFASCLTRFMNMRSAGLLAEIDIPLAVIWGEDNIQNPSSQMELLEKIKPQAQFYLFEKTRLLPHYENSEEFNQIAASFLNGRL